MAFKLRSQLSLAAIPSPPEMQAKSITFFFLEVCPTVLRCKDAQLARQLPLLQKAGDRSFLQPPLTPLSTALGMASLLLRMLGMVLKSLASCVFSPCCQSLNCGIRVRFSATAASYQIEAKSANASVRDIGELKISPAGQN